MILLACTSQKFGLAHYDPTCHPFILMTQKNGAASTVEKKLLGAVAPHLEKLSDEAIATRIAATEKILAGRAESRGASRPTPATRRQ